MIDPITAFNLTASPSQGSAGLERGGDAALEAMKIQEKEEREKARQADIERYLLSQGVDPAKAMTAARLPINALTATLNRKDNQLINPVAVDTPAISVPRGDRVSDSTVKELAKDVVSLDETAKLTNSFKNEYANKGLDLVGEAENFIGKRLPDLDESSRYAQQAAWWTALKTKEDAVRHGLYAGSLTRGEIEQWQKITITPGMNASAIKEGLKRREEIERNAARRKVEAQRRSGRNTGTLQELMEPQPTTPVLLDVNGGGGNLPLPNESLAPLPNAPANAPLVIYGKDGRRIK